MKSFGNTTDLRNLMTYDEYTAHDCTLGEDSACSTCEKWAVQNAGIGSKSHWKFGDKVKFENLDAVVIGFDDSPVRNIEIVIKGGAIMGVDRYAWVNASELS